MTAQTANGEQEPQGNEPGTRLSARTARFSRCLANVLACFLEEPIGIAAPLLVLVAFLSAPQMPDMFAGLKVGSWQGGPWYGALRPFFLGLGAALLGFQAWYWTRAALMATERMDDFVRRARHVARPQGAALSPAEWSRLWTPRLALLISGFIAASPLIAALTGQGSGYDLDDAPIAASLTGMAFVAIAFLITRYRMALGLSGGAPALPLMWRFRATSILAAAPFGWPLALLLIALSGTGAWVIALHPAWIDTYSDTPSAALLALSFVIGPIVLALAVLRDIVNVVLAAPLFLIRGVMRLLGRPDGPRFAHIAQASDVLGLLLLLVLLYLPSLVNPLIRWAPPDFYKVRTVSTPLAESEYSCGAWAFRHASAGAPAVSGNGGLARPHFREAVAAFREARLQAGYPADKPMSVIIVAAEGGGSRAAVWLLSSMRMLDQKTKGAFGQQLFAISGVSGGSLGAVTYLQALRAHGLPSGGLNWQDPAVDRGLKALGEADLLSASIATYFMNDAVGRLLGPLWHAPDRGEALEHSFERHWSAAKSFAFPETQAEEGLIALRQQGPGLDSARMPQLFLNGTDSGAGQRVITSTVRFDQRDDLFAASDDLLTILGHDVPASVAVTNSARFPLISPAGRFFDKCNGARQLLDGGYFENYGARTASEVAGKITQLSISEPEFKFLVPIVVVISDDASAYRSMEEAKANDGPTLWADAIGCRGNFSGSWRPPSLAATGKPEAPAPSPAESAAVAPSPDEANGADYGIESAAPLLGLYAAHGAYAKDALHILRRQLCPARGTKGPARMINIALPKPDAPAESAPLNWVLNGAAKSFLLGETGVFDIAYNDRQAKLLVQTLSVLREAKATPSP